MRANTNGHVKPLIRSLKQIHEVLPLSSHLLVIGHLGHGLCLIKMEVDRSDELGYDLKAIIQMERDHVLNAKLLHETQSLSKVVTVLVLPRMIHVNPVHVHIGVLLGLDHIQIDKVLLLGPEQIIPSEVSTGIHIGVDLPSNIELGQRYLIHAHGGIPLLGGGVLGSMLGGIGAPWSFILVAQPL